MDFLRDKAQLFSEAVMKKDTVPRIAGDVDLNRFDGAHAAMLALGKRSNLELPSALAS